MRSGLSNPTPHYGMAEEDHIEQTSNSMNMFKTSGSIINQQQVPNELKAASSFTVGNISAPSVSFKEELKVLNLQPQITILLTEMIE